MSNNSTVDYYIAPMKSFEATADAIRAKTGSQASITWGQNGFADAIDDIDYFDYSQPTGAVVFTGNRIEPLMCMNRIGIESFTATNATVFANMDNQKGSQFRGCTNLVSASFPKIAYSTNTPDTFRDCVKLTAISLPQLTAHYGGALFTNCSSLPGVVLPMLGIANKTTGEYGTNANYNILAWFNGCTSFKYLDVNSPYQMGIQNTFNGDTLFDTLIIRGERVTALNNVNVFDGCPFASGGTGGTLYVPNSLVSSYESATNWSTILSYPNNQIIKIEGSYYETHYADGTEIPTT